MKSYMHYIWISPAYPRVGTKPTPTFLNIPATIRMPISLLARMPDKLRFLAQSLETSSKAINIGPRTFTAALRETCEAFDDANNTATCIVSSFEMLGKKTKNKMLRKAIKSAQKTQALVSSINKLCGNIRSEDCFKATFRHFSTLDAVLRSLYIRAEKIRTVVGKLEK